MKHADRPPDLERLLVSEPVVVDLDDFSPEAEVTMRALLRLFDAHPSRAPDAAATIITFDRVSKLDHSDRAAVGAAAERQPLLVCPGTDALFVLDDAVLSALADIAGVELRGSQSASVSRYSFADASELRPLADLTLEEARPRALAAFDTSTRGVVSLVGAKHGAVFLKIERGRGIYVTVVPPPEAPDDGLLKNELKPERFMALLPLFVFLRAALAEGGWQMPAPRATFMIDDPNLRSARYGFLDLRQLVELGGTHNFHTSIAMIPLDYRKTRRSAAELVKRHPDRLSLVIHGVDHLHGEFARDVPVSAAEAVLAQGLARMEAHEQSARLAHARALTFPHGLCNEAWMEAMRNVGLDAAIVSRSFPFRLEADISEPLYELYPAEMTFRGFPVMNRFQAERPKERLLFQALVGKPLIVYTHHTFFRGGVERLLELAEFLNGHVSPRWESVDSIVRSNYEIKRVEGRTIVRTFSNRIALSVEPRPPIAVLKPGRDFPSDEVCRFDSSLVAPILTVGGVVAVIPEPPVGECEVAFGPAHPAQQGTALRAAPLKSHARRLATELRDQIVMPATARAAGVRQRIGRSLL
jgi:hypothetical protein